MLIQDERTIRKLATFWVLSTREAFACCRLIAWRGTKRWRKQEQDHRKVQTSEVHNFNYLSIKVLKGCRTHRDAALRRRVQHSAQLVVLCCWLVQLGRSTEKQVLYCASFVACTPKATVSTRTRLKGRVYTRPAHAASFSARASNCEGGFSVLFTSLFATLFQTVPFYFCTVEIYWIPNAHRPRF